MSKLQNKINKLSNVEFVSKYIDKTKSDIKLSEKRTLYKIKKKIKNFMNPVIFYNIDYEYTIVKNPSFLNSNSEVANKTIKDNVFFTEEDDANLYVNLAKKPSNVLSNRYEDGLLSYKSMIFLKGYEKYEIYVNSVEEKRHCFFSAFIMSGGVKEISHGYTLSEVLKAIDKYEKDNIEERVVIKTIDINAIGNKYEEIKSSVDKNVETHQTIIMSEIERTKEYLTILEKLL